MTTATSTAGSTRSARSRCSRRSASATGTAYFAALDEHLAPGGRVGLQTITMAHDRMLATRHTYTWIHKYIFPGGLLPSVTAIGDSLARTTLRITGREDFGAHYAETLRLWRERFGARSADVARLGFDEVFHRMWNFYLCYSEAGFRAGLHRRQPAHPGPNQQRHDQPPRASPRSSRPSSPGRPGPAGAPARLGRQRGRAGGRPGAGRPVPAGAAADPVAPGRARPGPRLRQRRPRRRGRPHRRPAPGPGARPGPARSA